MDRKQLVSHAILWAAAILASALTGAPPVLSTVLLPSLAACALLPALSQRRVAPSC